MPGARSGPAAPTPAPSGPDPASPGTAVADLAELVAAAATAVPGVLRLHAGPLGEIGTYLPGRRVAGVRLRPGTPAEVHVVVALDADLRAVAADVHRAVQAVARRDVRVVVADVA